MRLIDNSHISSWAGTADAKSRFPYWVRELILAVIQPDKLQMPFGGGVWLPGYDGVVSNGQQNPYVPLGESVWEFGTSAKVRDKANEDYEKRTKDPPTLSKNEKIRRAEERSQTTFVFATPLAWSGKDNWAKKRKLEGKWKDIIVHDGDSFKGWLTSATAVYLRFAAEIGRVPEEGLQSIDQAWDEWSLRTRVPTSEELVLAGRGEQEKALTSKLTSGQPKTFVVRASSASEAWGFTLAAIRNIQSAEIRESLQARTVVVDNDKVAGKLTNHSNLIVILKVAAGQVSGNLSTRGCHVVISEGNEIHSNGDVIQLARPSSRQFADALEHMNVPRDEAERIARACGLSVTILQRYWAAANYHAPEWLRAPNISSIIPALMAGRWSSLSLADRAVLCTLAGVASYDDVEQGLTQFLSVDDPPLERVGDKWTLTAPVDAFQLLAPKLGVRDLQRFEIAFRSVFGTIDPRVTSQPREFIFHDRTTDQFNSSWLRSGLAETLLLIAERGRDAKINGVNDPQEYASRVVLGIPGLNDDWRVLASIRDQYPRILEAAPHPLLDSLEHFLEAKPDDLKNIFSDQSSALWSVSFHTGVLWGLEALAWDPEFFARVTMLLARLAAIDPGGQTVNRPINSLKDILLWWYPGTTANTEQRLTAIDNILESLPQVGWDLLNGLLPQNSSTLFGTTEKPRWRNIGDVDPAFVSTEGQVKYLSRILDRAIDRVGYNPERWDSLLNALSHMTEAQQARVIESLSRVSELAPDDTVRSLLWTAVRDFVGEHRKFRDAQWALPSNMLDRIEEALKPIEPVDPIEQSLWLFSDWLPDIEFDDDDLSKQQQQVNLERQNRVAEIYARLGFNGLLQLGMRSRFGSLVADSCVEVLKEGNLLRTLTRLAMNSGANGEVFAALLSGSAKKGLGDAWRDSIVKCVHEQNWTYAQISQLFVHWPDEYVTWQVVGSLGYEVEEHYWKTKPLNLISGDESERVYQVEKLLTVGRSLEVLDRIALSPSDFESPILMKVLHAALQELAAAEDATVIQNAGLSSHDIAIVLRELRQKPGAAQEEVASFEYAFLPLLNFRETRGLTLHKIMAAEPKFFVEVLCDVFLPASRSKENDIELSNEAREKARAGFRLLEGFRIVPGAVEGGRIDEQLLRSWIVSVRALAKASDRSVIADQQIGAILARSPSDNLDNIWPHRAVRNVLENIRGKQITRGLTIERHNMRGAFSKAIYEGGKQERELAAQYTNWAVAIRERWPNVAQILLDIAKDWERMATSEDLRAEQDKRELS